MNVATVVGLFREGVVAVGSAVERWDDEQWAAKTCGDWNGTELAGHLVAVAGWYHSWLDRAEAGDAAPPFPYEQLADQNDRALAGLQPPGGPERIEVFQVEALRYADRVAQTWDLPYGYPAGTVTAGLHAAVAAAEWHLHAWDFARSAGGTHRPSDPAALFVATGTCLLTAKGGLLAAVQRPLLPLAARRDPWGQILTRSGRRPT